MSTTTAHPSHYQVEDHYTPLQMKRNFQLGVMNGVLYLFAASLFDPTLVLVAFLSHLTDSAMLLGLVVPIIQAGWSLPQLWISGYVQHQPMKIKIYRQATWIRIISWGILAAAVNLIRDSQALLVVFFATFIISSLASGLGGLPFMEVVSKTVPPRRRGEMFAWRFALGGLLSVAGSFFVRWILNPNNPLKFPKNYGVLSILFFVFASVALLVYNRVEEKPDPEVLPQRKIGAQVRAGLRIFNEEKNFRLFVFYQISMIVSSVAVPFFAVFIQREFAGNTSFVGVYLITTMISNLVVNILYGQVSKKMSNQMVLKIATLCGLLMTIWVLLIVLLGHPLGLSPMIISFSLIPAFILNSLRQSGIGVSANSLLLSITPPVSRAVMLGFTQTLLGVVLILTGFAGIVVDVWGFAVLLLITLIANLFGLFLVRSIKEGKE
ncbi:MAG: hypothetical protein CL609_05040 [Anaerolineaceae bacterium]|nr:hypothetical protein [Anaerolineaceae bacterium]